MIQIVADAIGAQFTGIAGLQVHVWDPGPAGLDALPCFVIGLPEMRRRQPDDDESELHAFDWHLTYPFGLYVDPGRPKAAQERIAQLLDAVVQSIDANPDLGITNPSFRTEDTVVSDIQPARLLVNEKNQRVAYEVAGEIAVHLLVT